MGKWKCVVRTGAVRATRYACYGGWRHVLLSTKVVCFLENKIDGDKGKFVRLVNACRQGSVESGRSEDPKKKENVKDK